MSRNENCKGLNISQQDKLRNKWSLVMSEIETKRNCAMKAEDDIKEVNKLVEELQKWLKELEAAAKAKDLEAQKELAEREADVERLQELCKELKAQRVGYAEKAVADVLAAWAKAREMRAAASKAKPVSMGYNMNYQMLKHTLAFIKRSYLTILSIVLFTAAASFFVLINSSIGLVQRHSNCWSPRYATRQVFCIHSILHFTSNL